MKLNDSKKKNNYFLFTLQNKLHNQKCQSELLKNEEVLIAIKLAALMMQWHNYCRYLSDVFKWESTC